MDFGRAAEEGVDVVRGVGVRRPRAGRSRRAWRARMQTARGRARPGRAGPLRRLGAGRVAARLADPGLVAPTSPGPVATGAGSLTATNRTARLGLGDRAGRRIPTMPVRDAGPEGRASASPSDAAGRSPRTAADQHPPARQEQQHLVPRTRRPVRSRSARAADRAAKRPCRADPGQRASHRAARPARRAALRTRPHSGTSSTPIPPQGWHRPIRRSASQPPLQRPVPLERLERVGRAGGVVAAVVAHPGGDRSR